ncbi:hypothetical protein Taro_010092 [Colocasia esculenta]|uniref:Uncharacterized protein n=1 Tax=Colocasia esculenta TaxID=4460 RepID=A0A843U7D1_COLES|nr:hypothetical protein [Colocasia esculenta]
MSPKLLCGPSPIGNLRLPTSRSHVLRKTASLPSWGKTVASCVVPSRHFTFRAPHHLYSRRRHVVVAAAAMADRRAGPLFLFYVLALVLPSCFIAVAAGDAEVAAAASIDISMLSPQNQVMAISTRKGLVMHLSVSGRGRGGGFSGARGGGGSSKGGSPRGSAGASRGKTKGGASRMPFGKGTTVAGAGGGSRDEKHSGGSQSWNNYLVVSAAATVVGIAAIVA